MTVYVVIAQYQFEERANIKGVFDVEDRAYEFCRNPHFIYWDLEEHDVRR